MVFSSSAPGSLMLFGEHAVLHGKQALCCAINQRIRVTLTPRQDQQIHLASATLGNKVFTLNSLSILPPFEFVLTAIDRYREQISQGFNLTIAAEFSATMGLGSSSAVTVAVLGTLTRWLGKTLSAAELFHEAKAVILRVQGAGSGADVAAAVFGGIVCYRAEPVAIQSLALTPDLVLVYSGAKMPTRQVIQIVAAKQRAEPERYQMLYEQIDACVGEAVIALQHQDWCLLGKLMTQHHALQEALGVSTDLLNALAGDLCRQPGIWGAKISGSGLGDCVVGLGLAPENLFPLNEQQRNVGVKQIPVQISTAGYRVEAESIIPSP
jgi:mevalonate kinase